MNAHKKPTFEVSTCYPCDGLTFGLDESAQDAVGRDADSSGWGMGERDLSWSCRSKSQAVKYKTALEKIGMPADVMEF